MSYTEKDFSACTFNPATKDLFGKYPELKELFSGIPPDDKVMRYVICMYDPKSPMVKKNKGLDFRKQECATYCGLYLDEEDPLYTFAGTYSDKGYENPYLDLVFNFLKRYSFPLVWVGIVADEQTFYEYSARLMRPILEDFMKDKDGVTATAIKSKLSTDKEDIRRRIEAGYDTMFGDNDNLKKAKKPKWTPEGQSNSV